MSSEICDEIYTVSYSRYIDTLICWKLLYDTVLCELDTVSTICLTSLLWLRFMLKILLITCNIIYRWLQNYVHVMQTIHLKIYLVILWHVCIVTILACVLKYFCVCVVLIGWCYRNERRLSPLGWRCLHALCQPFHGERERLIAEVLYTWHTCVHASATKIAYVLHMS